MIFLTIKLSIMIRFTQMIYEYFKTNLRLQKKVLKNVGPSENITYIYELVRTMYQATRRLIDNRCGNNNY